MARPLALLLLSLSVLERARAEVLTPPYFNLALGKKVTATATCGDEGPEMFCKLVGAIADSEEQVIQGQVCGICDGFNETKKHPPEYAVDGMETWWQSPPLSRGMKYNEVNFTIDLGQEFHVAYVFLRMGNSPRPGLWVLEKSVDHGKNYVPWMYFSDSPQDCERFFGKESLKPISRDNSVVCNTEYSKIVPLEGGEIPISLLNNRPSANRYFNSPELQDWTRATNVRFRFLRTKNLLGHLMSVARQDPTVTRRYFYSIKDISIGGRCMCNGHADTCDPADPRSDSSILVCRCQHNTCGPQCNKCCPGFEQKKWRISQNWNKFSCEPCNCHNHSTECEYDAELDEQHLSLDIHGNYEGGGRCKNCQDNTEGINCNKCQATYFRPSGKSWNDYDVCEPCNCNLQYSTGNCEEETGRCECRKEFNPPNCDSCAYGYFDYPDCKPCTCNLNGTEGAHCTPIGGICPCKYNYAGSSCEICQDGYYSPECKFCECDSVGSVTHVCDKESGNCTCKSKFAGRTCNQCEPGYYNYPTCSHCNCDTSGTGPGICDDITGQCICKPGFGGARCDQCIAGYYMEVRGRERVCVACNCSSTGSTSTTCSADGKCNCLANFGGKQCDQCSPGYYKLPECLPCNCDVSGSKGSTCEDNGQCRCLPNFDGPKCSHCKESFYNYPACESCDCNPDGVIPSFAGCGSVPLGELCQCKERVQGRICNDCKPLFWNLKHYNPNGCEECNCNLAGTLGGLGACNTKSGQCVCKMHVGERQCDQCLPGFYSIRSDDLFGCTECDCDVGGSEDNNCNKVTGQCVCHSRVEGRRCDRPIRAHYFPTLYQYKFELEDGFTRSGPVRYRSSEDVFPDYSWKGYVVFSILQNEVINIVNIEKSTFYRMVVKYANPLKDHVVAQIVITPESVVDTQQKFNVLLRPTELPQLVTVAGEKGNAPSHFVMNPGNWTLSIKTTKEVMIDYFVLIPSSYYEATILTKLVDNPCVVGDKRLCRQYAYPNLKGRAEAKVDGLVTSVSGYLDNDQQLKELSIGKGEIPLIGGDQNELQYNMHIAPNGPYVLLVEYVTPVNKSDITSNELEPGRVTSDISVKGTATVRFLSGSAEFNAFLFLNECPYTAPCRQVIVDELSKISLVDVVTPDNVVFIEAERETLAGILSIKAIPESEWHLDYLTPRPYCVRKNGECAPATFTGAVDSKKVEVENGTGGEQTRPPILDNSTAVVYLTPNTEPIGIDLKVPSPGLYMLLLHFYQPDHPEFKIDAVLNASGAIYKGHAVADHCPSNSGCRSLLQLSGKTQFQIDDNATLVFLGNTSKGVWLDYVLVVAAPDFVESALRESNHLDYTREFIEKCALNHYYINPNETGFCRDALFSITTDYNLETLQCRCDLDGSLEFECATFGGQCKCKPNVIGRQCNACKTGYYGFPDCKPCSCPATAICDDDGRCICPKNVEGVECDHCKPLTFNFDTTRGCDDCGCDPQGVENNQLQCHEKTGDCGCKVNVVGRTCDRCSDGHYAFPECPRCSCDETGTTDAVCDQNTAQCFCKSNARGERCNTCKDEYFNLQADNPVGCTKCFCFGKTTRCTSSDLSWDTISGMTEWTLVNINVDTLQVEQEFAAPMKLNETAIGAELSDGPGVTYFGAPQFYLGKRIASYGGYLNYTIFYTTRSEGHAIDAADIIIGSPNGVLIHRSIEQPPSLVEWKHSVRITEEEFTNLDGSRATREQLMNVLVNLSSLYLRATYWQNAVTTRLMNVGLDVGMDYPDISLRAESVEKCQCPSAYRGLSCEQCAEGHYRLSTGPHAGLCVPCQCNSHTDHCDVNTGECLNCQDNTRGQHCEQCIEGYHGDATLGTPMDCLICACPMPVPSNNFATSCDLSDNGTLISCQCKPGYGGANCNHCSAGYYGRPDNYGDYCKPCNCSGNINANDPSSCDTVSGDCLKCVNNTAGQACNLCAPGFYGDAILFKNCTACICDEYGMDHCNPATGTCVCRPGVEGEKCDRCAPEHWGLNSRQGCTPCDCGLASESSQCDDTTGQCRCAKGVTGRHCEQCAAGYWNYTKDGCDHCNCNSGYSLGFMCNADGQCECLPGVIGEKCDRCPDRWVLLPNEGCQECDACTDALIFSIEDLRDLLANETQEFKNKADSYFTTQRLTYISQQIELLPKLPLKDKLDLENVISHVKDVENRGKNLLRSAEFAATDSEKQITRSSQLAQGATKALQSVRQSATEAEQVVSHVGELATGLELSQQPKVDSALAEATQIRNDIAEKNLEPKKEQATLASYNATQQLERMNIFVIPVNEQAQKFHLIVNNTKKLKDKLADMLVYIDLAQHTATEGETLNFINKKSDYAQSVQKVQDFFNDTGNELIESAIKFNNATYYKETSAKMLQNSTGNLKNINDVIKSLGERIVNVSSDIPKLETLKDEVEQHVEELRHRAVDLRNLAQQENNNPRTRFAYSAASAYSSIVQEIESAKNASDSTDEILEQLRKANNAINNQVQPVYDRSNSLLENATRLLQTGLLQLTPNLTKAEDAFKNAKDTVNKADDDNKAILLATPTLPTTSLESDIERAEKVSSSVKDTVDIMGSLSDDLTASKEKAQTLPKLAHDAKKMVSNTESLLNSIKIDDVLAKYDGVKRLQDLLERGREESDEKRQKLKDVIEQARTVANRIQVAVVFDKRSTLEPRLPDTIDELSTSSHVSLYFRTKEKDGLLLYLGNPKDTNLRRTKSDDFMVLAIGNGYPYLTMDIGDGAESGREPAKVASDAYVSDNKWHQIIVDRVGRNLKLTVRSTHDNGTDYEITKDAVLPGQHTIFNLDKDKSKLYVGGVPAGAKVQGISYLAFDGTIEELMIGDTPVGLWNFVNAANLVGARPRDKLITSQSGPQEYRFNGRSHVTMPGRRYLLPQENHVLLFFKTYAPDGLIYLTGEGTSFFSIQMQDGYVFLQVSLGNPEDMVIVGTNKRYNDGEWHRLDAGRNSKACSLKVDQETLKKKSSSTETEIKAMDTMNFGGNNKMIPQVTSKGFDGCLRQISIKTINLDLADSVEAIGLGFTCQYSSLVSLSGGGSYLRYANVSSENIQLTLKFKTSEPDGLLFVFFSRMQTTDNRDSISLSLVKGKLVLMSQREQLDSGNLRFDDSQWHVVTVTHSSSVLTLAIDDTTYISSDTEPLPLRILDGVLFVGGLQPGYVVGGSMGTESSLVGCVADASLNGRVLNLLRPHSASGVTFGRCGATTHTGGLAPDNTVTWGESHPDDFLPTPMPQPVTTPPPFTPEPETPDLSPARTQAPVLLTTPPTVPSTSRPPVPEKGCALAYDPQYIIGDPTEGYRFGTRNDSRIEFSKLPGRQSDGFDLTVTFRTFDQHGGLIFYASAARNPDQFLAIYMKSAQVHFAFNCGGETAVVSSITLYNDTEWHTLTVVRSNGHGKLTVDSDRIGEASNTCFKDEALAPPYYYGGLKNLPKHVMRNLEGFYQPFKGCLRSLQMNGHLVTDVAARANSLRCTDNIENGVYFGPSGTHNSNYLKLLNRYRVGNESSISMEVKPRNSTGLLFIVYGRKDYLVLELLENEVVASVQNGRGEFQARYQMPAKTSLCDGKWHKIHAVKSLHVVSIGVDNHFTTPGIGVSASTDTQSALYIGGHKGAISDLPGVRSKHGYSGCIRNIVVGGVPVPVPLSAANRNTHVGVCPND